MILLILLLLSFSYGQVFAQTQANFKDISDNIISKKSDESLIVAKLNVASYLYDEPGVMNESGFLVGPELRYQKQMTNLSNIDINFTGEAELLYGNLTYEGAYNDTKEAVTSDTLHTIITLRPMLQLKYGPIKLHSGLGYRQAYDNIQDQRGGHLREIQYLYLPLGITYEFFIKSTTINLSAEYDHLINGKVKQHTEPLLRFNLGEGKGYRLSINSKFKYKQNMFFAELYYRRWSVSKSNSVYVSQDNKYYFEPDNQTSLLGISAGLQF